MPIPPTGQSRPYPFYLFSALRPLKALGYVTGKLIGRIHHQESRMNHSDLMNRNRRRLLGAAVAITIAGASVPSKSMAGDFLVTPWTASANADVLVTCTNCALAGSDTAQRAIYVTNPSTGTYQVRFTGTPVSASAKIVAHVTALGVPGARCMPYYLARTGGDYFMNIDCQRGGSPVNTRVMIDLTSGSGSWSGRGRATAVIVSNALTSDTWSSSGQAPTLSHPSLGNYTVQFPGLNDQTSGGNAQATATSYGKHCSLTSWGTSTTGSSASVACYDASDNLVDSNVMISFEQVYGSGQQSTGFIWSDSPTVIGTSTPASTWNRGVSDSAAGPTSMTVNHYATGHYMVNVGRTPYGANTGLHAQVTAWGAPSTCNVIDLDIDSVHVACSDRNGKDVDSYFSLLYGNDNTFFIRGYYQATATNFDSKIDVGQGLACGTSPTQAGVICVTPSSRSQTSPVHQVGGGVPPASVKSVAIASVDGSAATVLVLGTDNVVYKSTGNLGPYWGWGGGFSNWTVLLRPVDKFNAAVTLKKIISVRATSSGGVGVYTIVGLTTAGKTLITHAGGEPWAPYNLSANANATYLDISHGRDDVYAIQSDNTMVFMSFAGGYGGLPPLPNGLLPIAIGGRYVMTNAGKSGNSYPCTTPKDAQGNYKCPGAPSRIYRLSLARTWVSMQSLPFTAQSEPAQWDPDVLKYGDPLASTSPTVVDGDAFEGNFGNPFVWQYFSRLYQLNQ